MSPSDCAPTSPSHAMSSACNSKPKTGPGRMGRAGSSLDSGGKERGYVASTLRVHLRPLRAVQGTDAAPRKGDRSPNEPVARTCPLVPADLLNLRQDAVFCSVGCSLQPVYNNRCGNS